MASVVLTVPAEITFEQAIAQTQALIAARLDEAINAQEFAQGVQALVAGENGARGFFVTYLTLEHELADRPDEFLINALQSSPAIVGELLVKNLAMSTAMAITHRRNRDEALAQGSDRVQRRTQQLMQRCHLPELATKAQELYRNAGGEAGQYSDFLERWGYDSEQKQAIQAVLQPWITGSQG
ncbi:MAG: hypothetical protein Q6J33_01285 [Gloeomargarita sp. DG_2_bins_126]